MLCKVYFYYKTYQYSWIKNKHFKKLVQYLIKLINNEQGEKQKSQKWGHL